jgi:hypothetical protein
MENRSVVAIGLGLGVDQSGRKLGLAIKEQHGVSRFLVMMELF